MLPSSRSFAADPAARKLGVALVGLGGYSTGQLAPALRETRHCRLAGVVTGDRAKGLAWARQHGFPEKNVYGYDTMTRLADNPDIDIVYVVTPNALHAEHTIAAARAGKHVICEKPMAISVAECDAMIAACRQAGVQLSIGYRMHFDPYAGELMRLAQAREFGPFQRVDGAFSFNLNRRVWRAQKALAGGGPLMDLGIYVIQGACMAVGGPAVAGQPLVMPVAVTAREIEKQRPDLFADVEETIAWTLEFADGAHAEGRTSYQEQANKLRADAAHGWIEMAPAYSYGGLRARTSRGPLHFESVNQQARQMDDFALCVQEHRASRVSGEMGRRDLAIIEAIYAAARTSQRVPLAGAIAPAK
ncbi:glucose-fructose oxidoreductase [Opitutus sp. ER46]|nr:glucose-fructose oxidoreductase [Opitutus sp. ER46]